MPVVHVYLKFQSLQMLWRLGQACDDDQAHVAITLCLLSWCLPVFLFSPAFDSWSRDGEDDISYVYPDPRRRQKPLIYRSPEFMQFLLQCIDYQQEQLH